MHSSIYLHPMRTIFTSWESLTDSPTLVDYREFEPMAHGFILPDTLGRASVNRDALTVAVHTSSLIYHTFPFDAAENLQDRVAFELREFAGYADQSEDYIRRVRHSGKAYGADWISLLVIPQQLRRTIHEMFGTQTAVVSDIEADIAAAKLEGNCVLIGCRGDFVWTASVRAEQAPYHLERRPITAQMPTEMLMEESLTEHEASVETTWSEIRLYGDNLTPLVVQTLADSIVGKGRIVQRFNPFKHVRALVPRETQDGIIKRAHILSPLVGAVLNTISVDAPV